MSHRDAPADLAGAFVIRGEVKPGGVVEVTPTGDLDAGAAGAELDLFEVAIGPGFGGGIMLGVAIERPDDQDQ